MLKSAQAITVDFIVMDGTGALSNADSTPTGTVVVNGTDNGATVTVTNKSTGIYKAAVTLPSLSAGDIVQLRINATVGTVASASYPFTDTGDTKRVSDLNDAITAPTTAQIATGVWQDATAGDFTASATVGKSVMNGVALGTGLTINAYTGNTAQTGDNYARIGAAGAGLTALGDTRIANLDATVSSRTKPADTQARVTLADTVTTYTGNTPQTGDCYPKVDTEIADIQSRLPAALTSGGNIKAGVQGFLDSVFTEGATGRIAAAVKQFFNIASPAATMDHGVLVDTVTTATTATNLTNAPTSGDFTSTMKTSIGTALETFDPPTKAELDTAQGVITSAITALNNLSEASIRTAVGLASANLDTQLASKALASALTTAQAALTKIQAAVYDSASVSGSNITLSNAAVQTVTSGGRVTA